MPPAYIEALRDYYRPHLGEVCADDRQRFEKNPLRLLDCKEERCQPIIAGAPRLADYLCDACRQHFASVREYLDAMRIAYSIDDRLVRGLDYYTRTVWEFHPLEEGAQSSIGSGGRYDGLIELLGGAPTPGVGFGTGFERLILNMKRQELPVPDAPRPAVYIAHLTPEGAAAGLQLAAAARAAGAEAIVGPQGRSLKAQMRHANALGARYVAIIGAQEVAAGEVTLRDLADGSEQRLRPNDAVAKLEVE